MKHMKMAVMAACAMILLFISPQGSFCRRHWGKREPGNGKGTAGN